jgi:hypothetical protein
MRPFPFGAGPALGNVSRSTRPQIERHCAALARIEDKELSNSAAINLAREACNAPNEAVLVRTK